MSVATHGVSSQCWSDRNHHLRRFRAACTVVNVMLSYEFRHPVGLLRSTDARPTPPRLRHRGQRLRPRRVERRWREFRGASGCTAPSPSGRRRGLVRARRRTRVRAWRRAARGSGRRGRPRPGRCRPHVLERVGCAGPLPDRDDAPDRRADRCAPRAKARETTCRDSSAASTPSCSRELTNLVRTTFERGSRVRAAREPAQRAVDDLRNLVRTTFERGSRVRRRLLVPLARHAAARARLFHRISPGPIRKERAFQPSPLLIRTCPLGTFFWHRARGASRSKPLPRAVGGSRRFTGKVDESATGSVNFWSDPFVVHGRRDYFGLSLQKSSQIATRPVSTPLRGAERALYLPSCSEHGA